MSNEISSDSDGEDSDEAMITRIMDRLIVDGSSHGSASQGRGRPKIQESWTRVINIADINLDNLRTYVIATDLLVASGLPTIIEAPT